MSILITGGAGFIGSHSCVEFLEAGHDIVIYDNFENSNPIAVQRIEMITGQNVPCVKGDIRNQAHLEDVMRKHNCHSVVHFAGLKAVGESTQIPLSYYENNVQGTISLLKAMQVCGIYKCIFSSSATVYGTPEFLPYTEEHPLRTINPYGRTKLMIEDILRDLHASDAAWSIAILRYFNPVGAHKSGLIGEDPQGVPNNLMPFITQVATGHREKLSIFGGDYETRDGSGVRDYIHVVDLAQGHLAAYDFLQTSGCTAINLGTGQGHSVLEVVKAFEHASKRKIAYEIMPRRAGDLPEFFAQTDFAYKTLGWRVKKDLTDMCKDAWNWASKNPRGYQD
ncbi:MAG: UDP-glucose 4-epimerase GalE [Litorimonas sp.]